MEEKKIIEDIDFNKALAEFEVIDGGKTYKDIQEAVDELNDYDDGEEDVECGWCHEMWPETDCRYEVDLGYLCPQCEQAIKSRGEKLTFEEGHCKGHHCGEKKLDEKDCKKYKVITHSDDEEPVDCFGKKKPLDKPLTESRLKEIEIPQDLLNITVDDNKLTESKLGTILSLGAIAVSAGLLIAGSHAYDLSNTVPNDSGTYSGAIQIHANTDENKPIGGFDVSVDGYIKDGDTHRTITLTSQANGKEYEFTFVKAEGSNNWKVEEAPSTMVLQTNHIDPNGEQSQVVVIDNDTIKQTFDQETAERTKYANQGDTLQKGGYAAAAAAALGKATDHIVGKAKSKKKATEAIRIKDDDGSETFIADEVIDQLDSNRDDVNDWVRQHDDRKIVKEAIDDIHTYEIRAEWLSKEEREFCEANRITVDDLNPYYVFHGSKDALKKFHDRFYPESTFDLDAGKDQEDIHGFETRCPALDGELVEYCKEHDIGFDCDGRMSAFFGTIEQLQLLHDEFFPNSEFTIDGEPYISPEEKERLEAEYAANNWTDVEWDDEEIDDLSDDEKKMIKLMADFQDDEEEAANTEASENVDVFDEDFFNCDFDEEPEEEITSAQTPLDIKVKPKHSSDAEYYKVSGYKSKEKWNGTVQKAVAITNDGTLRLESSNTYWPSMGKREGAYLAAFSNVEDAKRALNEIISNKSTSTNLNDIHWTISPFSGAHAENYEFMPVKLNGNNDITAFISMPKQNMTASQQESAKQASKPNLTEGRGTGKYTQKLVTCDGAGGDEFVYKAYTDGADWNGWDCPFFEKEEADRLMSDFNGAGMDGNIYYKEENDAYYFHDNNYPEDPDDQYEGLDLDTVDGLKHVYAIGAWSWTWYEYQGHDKQMESKGANLNKKLIKEALEISDASVLDRLNGATINHMKRGTGTIEQITPEFIDADFNGVKTKLSTLICLSKGLVTFEDPEIAAYVESTVKPAIVDPSEQRNAAAKAQADAEAAMSEEERKALAVSRAEAKAEDDFAKGKEFYDRAVKNHKKYIVANSGIAMLANEVAASQAYIAKIELLKATAKAEESAAHKIETLVQATQALHTGDEDYAPYIKDIVFTLPVVDANATITPKQAKRTIAKMATLKKGLEAQFPEITSSSHFKEVSKKENQNDWYNMWGLTGKVVFTKPVSELPASLQAIIEECTRISQENAKNSATMTKNVTANTTEVSNVYLAFALLNELGDWHLLDGENDTIKQDAEEKPFDLF